MVKQDTHNVKSISSILIGPTIKIYIVNNELHLIHFLVIYTSPYIHYNFLIYFSLRNNLNSLIKKTKQWQKEMKF